MNKFFEFKNKIPKLTQSMVKKNPRISGFFKVSEPSGMPGWVKINITP